MPAGEVRGEFRHARESSFLGQVTYASGEPGRESCASSMSDHARHVGAPFTGVQKFPGVQKKIEIAVVGECPVEGAFQDRSREMSEAKPEQGHSQVG